FDVVLDLAIELEIVGESNHAAIRASANEAALQHVLKKILVLAFLAANDRREHQEAGAAGQGKYAGDDLLARLRGDRPAAFGAVPLTDTREEDPKVIVNLGDRADGGAGVAAGGLLLDADAGRQTRKIIHVRLLHLPQKLPGIAGKRFDVAPLPLGVKGIE